MRVPFLMPPRGREQGRVQAYRADIDGLRALAVLSVIFHHYLVPGFRGGFVGVDVFFVISGFLIAAHIESEIAAGRFSLLAFYERRIRRILPALFLMYALFLLLACICTLLSETFNRGASSSVTGEKRESLNAAARAVSVTARYRGATGRA